MPTVPITPAPTGNGSLTGTTAPTLFVTPSGLETQAVQTTISSAVSNTATASAARIISNTTQNPQVNSTGNSSIPPNYGVAPGASVGQSQPSDKDIQTTLANFLAANYGPNKNPLNDYFQVAYHWRLFAVNDKDIFSGITSSMGIANSASNNNTISTSTSTSNISDLYTKIDNANPVIIAETGVTTYNITSVEITGFVGPNNITKNTSSYSFLIHITEPMGVGFFNSLKEAAVACGILNMNQAPYYLELSFRAYDDQGNLTANPVASEAYDASRWIWQVLITQVDTKFNSGGGKYTLTAIAYSDLASSNANILTSNKSIIAKGKTVKEFLDSMQDQFNKNIVDIYEYPLIQYNFKMFPIQNPPIGFGNDIDPNNYVLKNLKTDGQDSQATKNNDSGVVTATFTPGTSYKDMITYLTANIEKLRNMVLDRDNTAKEEGKSATETNNKKFKEYITFQVEDDIVIGVYDLITKGYRKTVNVNIIPYYSQAPIVDTVQVDNAKDPSVQAAMLKALLNNNFLVKNYQYIFTGQNTEVLDFDISAKFDWSYALPRMGGAHMNVDSIVPGKTISNDSPTNKQNTNKPEQANRIKQILADNQNNIMLIQQSQAAQAANIDQLVALQQLQNPTTQQQQTIKSLTSLVSNAVTLSAPVTSRLGEAGAQLQSLASSAVTKTKYAEDLFDSQGNPINKYVQDYISYNLNTTFEQGYRNINSQTGTGFIGDVDRDRGIFGSVIDQLYQPTTANLLNIEITIRGDPFWIGASNLQKQLVSRLVHNQQSSKNLSLPNIFKGLPNFTSGYQVFLLSFRYPVSIDSGGNPVFREDNTFTAFYQVQKIISNFSDGKFTQVLTGYALPLLKPGTAITSLNNNFGIFSANQTSPLYGGGGNGSFGTGSPSITTSQQQTNATAFAAALKQSAAQQGITLTDAQIDGITANAYRESSMNPNNLTQENDGNTSYGLLQWNSNGGNDSRLQSLYDYTGTTNPTIQQQADFTIHELQQNSGNGAGVGTLANLQAQSTPQGASAAFLTGYERPANPTAGISVNNSYLGGDMYGNGAGVGFSG